MTQKMVFGKRIAAALVLAALVTAVPANASPLPGSWARLAAWLGPVLAATIGEEGPAIDPDGNGSTSGQGDAGPAINPDGNWSTSGQGDDGVAINPDGRKG